MFVQVHSWRTTTTRASEAASGFFIIGRQQRRSAEENHKKERTKMFHDLKRPVTIHSMEGQNKKFVRYSLRPSLSSAVPSFEFWSRIRARLVCFFLFCFFSCLGFFLVSSSSPFRFFLVLSCSPGVRLFSQICCQGIIFPCFVILMLLCWLIIAGFSTSMTLRDH